MVDIARPESVVRNKKIKRVAYGVVGLTVVLLMTVFVSRLKPAAPSVEKGTVWPGVVERGPMVRQVRGTGTLVPEDTRWIPASTAGRVERILLRSGSQVSPDSIVVELSNPELEQTVVEARLQLESAQAQLTNRRAELDSALLTQRAAAANIESEARQARMRAEADALLLKEGLVDALNAKINQAKADDLANRTGIERKRLEMAEQTLKSQLAVQETEVSRLRTTFELRRQQLEKLKVRAGIEGVLQVVPVEVGAQMTAGQNIARVADPTRLKAELRIPETQARDIEIGQIAEVDTRNGKVNGKVSRIDAAAHERDGDGRCHPGWRAPPRRSPGPDRGRHGGTRTAGQRSVRRAPRVRAGAQHDHAVQGRGRVPCAADGLRGPPDPGQVRTQLGQHHRGAGRAETGRPGRVVRHVAVRRARPRPAQLSRRRSRRP